MARELRITQAARERLAVELDTPDPQTSTSTAANSPR